MALDQIIAHTRAEVARRKAQTGPDAYAELPPSDRSLVTALSERRTGFILEYKKASPSRGPIRPDADVGEVARAYAAHADAISVLTNTAFFNGSFEDLAAVRAIAPQPILCKDFVVDPWQVREARAHGADAILLMLSVLDDADYAACAREAEGLNMDTLTEAHTEHELALALSLGAPIIGINNRDLHTLTTDLRTVRQLAPLVPRDRLLVCESGIGSHEDVRALRGLVDGFLVGSTLMSEADLPRAVRRVIFGTTKVCGLTRVEDARAAEAFGATHGGLIFAAESPRMVTLDQAKRVRDAARLEWVGVFVNPEADMVVHAVETLHLSAAQMHGEETPDWIRALRGRLPSHCEIWKAVRVRDAIPSIASTGADRVVLDGWAADRRGGTGTVFDWSLLERYDERERVLLGGGLTPALAADAAACGTWGLDVNSGVEQAPGVKDPAKMAAFFAARRGEGRTRRGKDD